jgi:murein DD-endopeptidase MepM/ murein hydrolase activator NlpD
VISIIRPPAIVERRPLARPLFAGPAVVSLLIIAWPSKVARLDREAPAPMPVASLAALTPRHLGIRPADSRRLPPRKFSDALYPPEGVYWVEIHKQLREIRVGIRDHTRVGAQSIETGARAVSSEPLRIEVLASGDSAGKTRTFVPPAPYDTRVAMECAGLGSVGGRVPVSGWGAEVSSAFDPARRHPVTGLREPHLGVDIAAALGAGIVPVLPGVVVGAGPAGDYGTRVIIRHDNGLESLYAHMLASRVRLGDSVTSNDTIGLVGWSGNATGPHLHFELWRDSIPFDPCEVNPS